MSVVGFDLGNLQSVIAVARNRGIDVICNEVSNRATPSLVSFDEKQRWIGEGAKTKEISKAKDTVCSLKRIVGRTFSDPEIQEVESKFIMAELADVQGQAGVKVNYLGERKEFTNVQLLAMLLGKLKNTTESEINGPVSDCVITVPGWFTEVQRHAVLNASVIAGLNCLRLVNDLTAAALGYGITKTDLPEDKPRNVAFVDIGHSSYSVSIVSFVKGQLNVRGTAYDTHFGGRDFDQVLVEHLAEQFKEKYKIDVFSNKKALLRLRTAAERCKKILSANPQAPVNIESIMDDKDVSAIVSRGEFEEWAAHLFTRTEDTVKKALENAGISVEDIDAVEMVGGSTRIPALKTTISQFFNKDVSTTLNQDEAVARGAALQCAILSPVFKVREFKVSDVCSYPIKMQWEATPEEEDTEIVVFDHNNTVPSTKILTFYRSEPFVIEALYAQPEKLPAGINPWIGQFSIKNVQPVNGAPAQIKVKVRLNIHGILSVESAYTVEQKEVEEETKNKDGEVETKKVKKLVKTGDLSVVSGTTSITNDLLNKYTEEENEMKVTDKLVVDTEAAKNSLEEYCYDMRSKIQGGYAAYIDPSIKDSFCDKLQSEADWLCYDGDDAPKSEFIKRLDELKKTGSPVVERFRESERRPGAARQLRDTVERLVKEAMSGDEKYSHIPANEKQEIVDRAERANSWLYEQLEKQEALPKHETPVVCARDIRKQEEEFVSFAQPILSRPKPAPPAAEEKVDEAESATPDAEGGDTPMADAEEKKENMDVD